ncbi:unnamed protein product [Soboliphyme baturini]|uniref:Kinesin motor domain-containing protein n=1 Tax=Soboliphyme baturini TaxID=241478 RepID=A0A183IML0_9BILA|nr:unnamed protein product [Soboliphyme baturini]
MEKVIDGSTIAVFVYGATGSGKTYTMVGNKNAPGLMDRTIDDLMSRLGGEQESLAPVYNEKVRDLLQPMVCPIELREDSTGNLILQGLSQIEISSPEEGKQLLADGNRRRTRKSTPLNYRSSRAHTILLIMASSRVNKHKQGKLYLIDLAGFERAGKTQVSHTAHLLQIRR